MRKCKKSFWRKIPILAITLTMTVGVTFEAGPQSIVEAAVNDYGYYDENYMENLNVPFDLELNKAVTYTEPCAVISDKEYSGKITNFKITDADVEGYKKLTFKYTDTPNWKPSKTEIHKECQDDTDYENFLCCFFGIVDYNTGFRLTTDNDYDVTVTWSDWKYSKAKKYKDNDGCYIKLSTASTNVSVIYPEDYTDLCIGVGGCTELEDTDSDNAFWDGEEPLGETSFYENAHYMRVTK